MTQMWLKYALPLLIVLPLKAQTLGWKIFGNLNTPRHYHSALAISDKEILVMGGHSLATAPLSGVPTRDCEIIDIERGMILPAMPMTTARAEFSALYTLDSNIVVLGGVTSSNGAVTSSCEIYNRTTRQWRTVGNLIEVRRQHTACFINANEILVVGGRNSSLTTLSSAEIFNVQTGQSRQIANYPYPVNVAVSEVAKNGDILVFAGRNGGANGNRSPQVYRYNISLDQWTIVSSLPETLIIPQIIKLHEGNIIISGGSVQETPAIASKGIYIENNSSFRLHSTMAIGRAWHGIAIWNNDTLVCGGGYSDNLVFSNSADWIDIPRNRSNPAPKLNLPRIFYPMVSLPVRNINGRIISGRVIAISGMNTSNTNTPTVEILEETNTSSPISIDTLACQDNLVSTFAGNGRAAAFDGIGTNASFADPKDIATDVVGNIYVADKHCIRKITPAGIVTTFAGDPNSSGFINGSGINARFNNITGIGLDKSGNIFVTDFGNEAVRKITPIGVVTTVAGGNGKGYRDGPAAMASFYGVYDVATDGAGNLYVADFYNNAIRKISNGIVSTFNVGSINNGPANIIMDAAGTLYVGGYASYRIYKITQDGKASILAGSGVSGTQNGTGTSASFGQVVGLALDAGANLYVADYYPRSLIRKITPTGVVTTLAGTGSPGYTDGIGTQAAFNEPVGIAVDKQGNLFISDQANYRIRAIKTCLTTSSNAIVTPISIFPTIASSLTETTDCNTFRLVLNITSTTGTINAIELGTAANVSIQVLTPLPARSVEIGVRIVNAFAPQTLSSLRITDSLGRTQLVSVLAAFPQRQMTTLRVLTPLGARLFGDSTVTPTCATVRLRNDARMDAVFPFAYFGRNVEFSAPPSQFPLRIPALGEADMRVCYAPSAEGIQRDTVFFGSDCAVLRVPLQARGAANVAEGVSRCQVPIRLRAVLPQSGEQVRIVASVPYPQPASDAVAVDFWLAENEVLPNSITATLFNSLGVEVGRGSVEAWQQENDTSGREGVSGRVRWQVASLPTGLYQVVLLGTHGERASTPVMIVR